MPNKDGTGPEGKGPATGRGKGPCSTTEDIRPCGAPCGRRRRWVNAPAVPKA